MMNQNDHSVEGKMRDCWPILIPILIALLATQNVLRALNLWQTDIRDMFKMSPEDEIRRGIEHRLDVLNSTHPEERMSLREGRQENGLPSFTVCNKSGDMVIEVVMTSGGGFVVARHDSFCKKTCPEIGLLLTYLGTVLSEYHWENIARYKSFQLISS